MTRRARAAVISAIMVLFLGTAAWYVFDRTDQATTFSADFGYVNGIYRGSKVTVLGVPVGQVTAVEPRGTTVRVSMAVPAGVRLPADVQAYIMSPALISDRSVDLGPAYRGDGPTRPPGRSSRPTAPTPPSRSTPCSAASTR